MLEVFPDGAMVNCGPLHHEGHETARPLRQRIFELVRASGPLPRAQVAKRLGISPGTVSVLTAELIQSGLLREDDSAPAATDPVRGRPPVGLSVYPQACVVAGIKLSSQDRTGLLVDFAGNRLASTRVDVGSDARDVETEIDEVRGMIDRMLADAGIDRGDLGAVGIGLPGFVHHASGRVHWSPLFETRDIELAACATDRLGVPVAIDNDANLVALAELWFGKGRETADFTVVTFEEGVGIGAVLGHRLFRGANGLGGELGHVKVQIDGALCRCGQRGCLEAYLSDYAIAREGATALPAGQSPAGSTPDQVEALQRAAAAGNEGARSIFELAQRYLALGLSNIVNLFDPSLLILSGGRVRYDWLQADGLRAEMQHFAIQTGRALPPLEIHEWGDLLWAHGAAALALDTVTEAELGAAREGSA